MDTGNQANKRWHRGPVLGLSLIIVASIVMTGSLARDTATDDSVALADVEAVTALVVGELPEIGVLVDEASIAPAESMHGAKAYHLAIYVRHQGSAEESVEALTQLGDLSKAVFARWGDVASYDVCILAPEEGSTVTGRTNELAVRLEVEREDVHQVAESGSSVHLLVQSLRGQEGAARQLFVRDDVRDIAGLRTSGMSRGRNTPGAVTRESPCESRAPARMPPA